jgi:hypothetical protein
MAKELTVALPSWGSLLREYIKTVFYYSAEEYIDEIKHTPSGFIVKSNNIRSSLSKSIDFAKQIVDEIESDSGAAQKFPVQSNDKRTINQIKNFFALKKEEDSISKIFKEYSEYLNSKCSDNELQLCLQNFNNGYSVGVKGIVRFAALSIFKPEQYEYGHSLGNSKKYTMNLDLHSTVLGMAGFIQARIGKVPIRKQDYITVLITPEYLSKKIENITLKKYKEGMKLIRGNQIPGLSPVEALTLWLGLTYSTSEMDSINVFAIREPFGQTPSSLYHRYTFNLKAFMSIAERIRNAGSLYAENYEYLLKEALKSNAKERTFAINIVKKIFQVINGTERPEQLIYIASREALVGFKSSKISFIRNIAPMVATGIQRAILSLD